MSTGTAPAALGAQPNQVLDPAVLEWVAGVQRLLGRRGRDDGVAELQELVGRPLKSEATIVVAGEDKRGKSSLVNAFVGRPGLSPVGVEVTTASPVTMFRADPPEAMVVYHDDPEPRPTPLEEAQSLATLQGNPLNEKNVLGVQIGIPAPELEGLVLVDTPGVGGLESGHAALTLQSLRSADVLLFVLEAGAQIREPELRFLKEAASRISRVVLAFTKVDLYRGWRQVAEDNQSILARYAPRLAKVPLVPISSVLASKAARFAGEDEEAARELLEESGVPELRRVVREAIGSDVKDVRVANLVQAGMRHLGPVELALKQQLANLSSPHEAQAALEEEQRKLRELNQERSEWKIDLDVELSKLTIDRNERIKKELGRIREAYNKRIDDLKKEEHPQIPGEFTAQMTAFAGELAEWTTERLVDIVARLVGHITEEVSVTETVMQLSRPSLSEELVANPITSKLNSQDKMALLGSFELGHSLVALGGFGGLALSSVIAPPLAIAVGVTIGGLFVFEKFRIMKHQTFGIEFRKWMNGEIARVQPDLSNNFERTKIDVKQAVRDLLQKAFAIREAEIKDQIANCQKAAQEKQEERQAQRRQFRSLLESVQQLQQAGRQLAQVGTD